MLNCVKPYLLLTILGLLFFGDLVLHPTQVLYSDHSDLLAMHLPMKRFLVRSWQQTGEIPLWNPYSFGGMPFVHDVQVAAFYPLHLPLYLLPEEYVGAGMSWLVVLHVILAGWLMFAYAGYRGLNQTGALVAALGFMFAGKWLLHVLAGGHYIMIPLAWLPLVLLFLEQAIERRNLFRATWAGATYALIVLGTHPQMTLYAGIFAGLWTFGCVLHRREPSQERQAPALHKRLDRQALKWWLLAGVWTVGVAILLSAVQLLPALEASGEAVRSVGVRVRDIVAVCIPSIMGTAGPGWVTSWEDRSGLGVLWIVAALTAALVGRGRVRFDGLVCVLLFCFAVGGAALVQWLPGFRLFQIPVRMSMLLALPVSLLVGRTTQAIFTNKAWSEEAARQHGQRLLKLLPIVALFAVGCAVPGLLAWQRENPPDANAREWYEWAPAIPSIYWIAMVVSVTAAWWVLANRYRISWFVAKCAWSILLLIELWALVLPHARVSSTKATYSPSALIDHLVAEQARNPDKYWRVLECGSLSPSSAPLGSALPMLGNIELQPVLGYNSFDVRRYKEYLQLVTDEDKPITPRSEPFGYPMIGTFPLKNKKLLDLLGVRYLLNPEDHRKDSAFGLGPESLRGWTRTREATPPVVYSFVDGGIRHLPPYTLYENEHALPRAFIVVGSSALADRPAVLKQMKSTDFRREVLLERSEAPSPRVTQDLIIPEPAQVSSYLPNRVAIRSKAVRPGYLVLTDIWFPGWKCTIDGQETPIYRANFLFRAVAVPAGEHEVVFRFDPASYRWGRLISVAALCLFGCLNLAALAFRWRARMRQPIT